MFINRGTAMWNARVWFFLLHLVIVCGKRFETRCKLAREMLKVGMPNDLFLGQWVCLAEKVSNRDTSIFTVSPSGKKFYGLYQIPSKWCKEKKPGGLCNIACENLLDDDIRDDTACALDIVYLEGFQYWPLWVTRCKNDNFISNEIYKCPGVYGRRRNLLSKRNYRRSSRGQCSTNSTKVLELK